jgi:uncharacterized protein
MDRRGRTVRYLVDHPKWSVYSVQEYLVDLDWESAYGPEWHFLQETKPVSTIFAVGSAVKVYPRALHDDL